MTLVKKIKNNKEAYYFRADPSVFDMEHDMFMEYKKMQNENNTKAKYSTVNAYKGMTMHEAQVRYMEQIFSAFMTDEEVKEYFPADMNAEEFIEKNLGKLAEFTKSIYVGNAKHLSSHLSPFFDQMELSGTYDQTKLNDRDVAKRKANLEALLNDLETSADEIRETIGELCRYASYKGVDANPAKKEGFGTKSTTHQLAPYILRLYRTENAEAVYPVLAEDPLDEDYTKNFSGYNRITRNAAKAASKGTLTLIPAHDDIKDPELLETLHKEREAEMKVTYGFFDKNAVVMNGNPGSASFSAMDRLDEQVSMLKKQMDAHCNPGSWFKSKEYKALTTSMNSLSRKLKAYHAARSQEQDPGTEFMKSLVQEAAAVRDAAEKYAFMKNYDGKAKDKNGTGLERYRNALAIAERVGLFLDSAGVERYHAMTTFRDGLEDGEPAKGMTAAKLMERDKANSKNKNIPAQTRDEALLLNFTGQTSVDKALLFLTRVSYVQKTDANGAKLPAESLKKVSMAKKLGINEVNFYSKSSVKKNTAKAASEIRRMFTDQKEAFALYTTRTKRRNYEYESVKQDDGSIKRFKVLSDPEVKTMEVFSAYDFAVLKRKASPLKTAGYNARTGLHLPEGSSKAEEKKLDQPLKLKVKGPVKFL